MANSYQTVSYLTKRFHEVGLFPESKHGQNFLIDINLLRLLAGTAQVGPNDVVLEVGTGTGSLTAQYAQQAAEVITVEIDARLHQLAQEELVDFQNITFLQQDVLKNKNRFSQEVLDTIKEKVEGVPGRQLKLAANLPYNVATPIISNLLLTEIVPVSMTVTIQKELADRIVAGPRSKDYGALSIWVQSQCQAEIVRVMPPQVFWPQPKVHSAILHIVFDPALRQRIPDLVFFHQFVRSMFFHRRKFLRSVLLAAFKKQLSKPVLDQIMEELGLTGTSRAEEQSVEMALALCEKIRQAVQPENESD